MSIGCLSGCVMTSPFILAPRYCLDDHSQWLQGIDPSRQYWLWVNGDRHQPTILSGLLVADFDQLKAVIQQFRALEPGENLTIPRMEGVAFTLHCVSSNCYAIAATLKDAPVWHLFDRETLESFLKSSHPDWLCSPNSLELGREQLRRAFTQPAYV